MGGNVELVFGKFKGLPISDPQVTTSYLEWLLQTSITTVEEIQAELARREQAEAGNLTLAGRMVVVGFRALAKESKDDAGAMRDLAGARAALEEVLERYFEDQSKIEETRQMNKTRDAKDSRNRQHAMKLLKDKNAEPDDIEWARKILSAH
jgi:hypothetical protein